MAIFYENEKNDRKAIYDAADKWKNECLLKDKSLIWDGESIWTENNIDRFRAIFIERPDESGASFDDKLQKQLSGESEAVYKFVIEMLFIYYLFPANIGYEKKMKNLNKIASWKGIEISSSPVLNGLNNGIGNTGVFYNTSKYFEVSFLFQVVEFLKTKPVEKRTQLIQDALQLKRSIENIRKRIGKKVQMQHILLHLLIPEKFERIASWGHKDQIVKRYSNIINDKSVTDTDEQLLMIRENLNQNYSSEKFDFYEPDIQQEWRNSKSAPKKVRKKNNYVISKTPSEQESNIPSVDFDDAHPFDEELIFEDFDVLMNQVTTALQNGKHIILAGPPGTGKSKLTSKICEMYQVSSTMVTASSNWSTYETIGGYRPDREGNLYFDDGVFLNCVKETVTHKPQNKWLIIDEINRADIDKAFGSLFSVLTGDTVTLPFESTSGKPIVMKPQEEETFIEPDDHTYVIPNDWRILATMNTIDKASLYEMSYAFMRRFAFIPVGIPKNINDDLIEQYLRVWGMDHYPHAGTLSAIWKLINDYRKIGPAIVEDIARHTQDNEDFASAVVLYVLPQFEGLPIHKIKEFIRRLVDETDANVEPGQFDDFVHDFFDAGAFE